MKVSHSYREHPPILSSLMALRVIFIKGARKISCKNSIQRKVLNLTLWCFSFWVFVRGPEVIYTQVNLISMWYFWALPLLRMLLNCLPYKLGICIHIRIYSTAMRANLKLNWEDSESAKQVLINHWQAEYNWLKFKYSYLTNVIAFKNGPTNKSLVSEPLFSWV